LRAALVCGADAAGGNEEALRKFIDGTRAADFTAPPAASITTSADSAPGLPALGQQTFFPFPTYQVSYTGLSLPTGPYTAPTTAPFAILAQLLTHRHLHHEIREKGGAYGGGASSNGLSGSFGMYSYRDPNPTNTLRIMREAGRWAAEREWTGREIEEAKLSVFQSVDAPVSVNKEGMGRFLQGIDYGMEQRRREWLLDVGPEQVRQAAEKLAEGLEGRQANVALLGKETAFVKEEGWEVREMGIAKKAAEAVEEAAAAG